MMTRAGFILGLALAACCCSTAAQQPSALAQATAGLWEISGVPGAKAPVRQCVADIAALAQFEHRGKQLHRKCASATGGSSTVDPVQLRRRRGSATARSTC